MSTRQVHLPLKSLEQCFVCHKKNTKLKLCSYCVEVAYCSAECQTKDWGKHKGICGKTKTDRISLDQFHPFLSYLAECNRHSPIRPIHIALTRKILNAPNPYIPSTVFPDGTKAKLVVLGEPIEPDVFPSTHSEWWPQAYTAKVRAKLARRFLREGDTLPLICVVLAALLGEMYTTPDEDSNLRRTRIHYKSSPIADFGIAKGSARVTSQDTFAFFDTETTEFWFGQDPKDHYWIYFTTLKGEELVLDFGMFTFNYCTIIPSEPYYSLDPALQMPPAPPSPCYFRNRLMERKAPDLHKETRRISVLRNPDFHRFVTQADVVDGTSLPDCSILFDFMESFQSRPLTAIEKELTETWVYWNTKWMKFVISSRFWVTWPAEPMLAVEQDPGEMDDIDDWKPTEEMKKNFRKEKQEKKLKRTA
ncbi:hypothetical protein FB446DRAFT_667800 [Lentinula raphanica]|nr:hypothetical protein FB446DRAFT_667800 [Lentinula raphanica]